MRGSLLLAMAVTLLTTLSASADYQGTVLADHPVGYWSLNLIDSAASNGVASDLSGNGNDGAYYNIYPGFNGVAGPSPYITNGTSFDGITAFVDFSSAPHTALLNFGGAITLEAWVQSANPASGANMDILGKGDDVSQSYDEIEMRLDAGGGFHGGMYNQGAGDKGVSGGSQSTNWTYLVTTYDGTNWNLYVNGALVAKSPDTVGAINFSDPWAIGDGTVDGNTRFLYGNLSQVALYTNALTPPRILTHYFIGLNGTTNVPPAIIQEPAAQAASPSAIVTFSCMAESLLPLTNQWYKDGTPLPNQTNATLVLNNVRTNDAGAYSVVIGNSAGTTNSVAANLTVNTQPTTIVWQTPQVISGASDVLTNGAYFGSWAPFNGGANGLPVNGVSFQGYSDLQGLTYSFSGGVGGYNGFGSPGTADTNYNALLQYGQYANLGGSSTFSWGGMTPGHTYEIQFWVEDARGSTGARWENLSGGDIGTTGYGTNTSGPVGYSSPLFSGNASPGYYIVGTFVADGTGSEEILLSPWGGSPDTQINLFQVRDLTPVSVPPAQPGISHISLSGTTLVISGTNGTAGLSYTVLTSTSLVAPVSLWTPIATNTFPGENFSVTNTVNPSVRQSFYVLRVP